jgi:ribosomal protein L30E
MDTIGKRTEDIIEEWYKNNKGFCKDKDELRNKLDGWLKDVTETEARILLELFAHSSYFSKRKVNNIFFDYYKKMKNKGYSIFTAIESQDIRQNSSHTYLNEFALVSGVSDYSIVPMLTGFEKGNLAYIKQIVFIDDIVGTGKTVTDYFETVKHLFAGKKIILWVVCITKYAKEKIEQYAEDNGISLDIWAYKVEEKAFEGGYIFDIEEASQNELIILDLEKRLWQDKKTDEFILGKDKSQCLLSFYNDTPNNTLSSFWFCSASWKPIFSRKKKQKPMWLKDKKRERTNKNYERSM